MNSHHILVTGGAGFIGSHLVNALIEGGHKVRVLDLLIPRVHTHHSGGRPASVHPDAEFIEGDVCDREMLERALDGIDVVYHEAAEVGVDQTVYEIPRYVKTNDLGIAVLLEATVASKDKVGKLVVASSMSIYGEGAYETSDGIPLYPQLRPVSQLLERRWEIRKCSWKMVLRNCWSGLRNSRRPIR